jgi:hypothetical protein
MTEGNLDTGFYTILDTINGSAALMRHS